MLNLSRHTIDPKELMYFQGAIASFGSLGIIYSITLKCVPAYNAIVSSSYGFYENYKSQLLEIAKNWSGGTFLVLPGFKKPLVRVRAVHKVHSSIPLPKAKISALDRVVEIVMVWIHSPHTSRLQWILKNIWRVLVLKTEFVHKLAFQGVGIVFTWINLEYGLPIENVVTAVDQLLQLCQIYHTKHKYYRFAPFLLRPVGADRLGFLSPTIGRVTCFIDIPYDVPLNKDDPGFRFYQDAEKILLKLGGRVSWARLFQADKSEVINSYPQFGQFLQVKRELDPQNVFSNEFSDNLLFD